MSRQFFITGTDTGVGKTVATGILAKHFQDQGHNVFTQKWVQAGTDNGKTDLDTHLEFLSLSKKDVQPYLAAMCPYTFKTPASPHLAASLENITINPHKITTAFNALSKRCDVLLVEGSGGFFVPYTDEDLLADIVTTLKIPVILVIGNKLGCINHSLLTIEAIQNRKLEIHGLIFNAIDPECSEEILTNNIETIVNFSKLPNLGVLPYVKHPSQLNLMEFLRQPL
jgi:dethiobiotin synthetase